MTVRRRGRHDVGVDARVVEPEPLPVLGLERPRVAVVGVLVGTAERDVGVAELAAHVLVVQRLGHEARDAREAPVGQRELADPVGALGRDHLLQDALVLLRARLRDAPAGEPQADALDEVAVPVQRLVEADPALGAAPVRAGEDLEAGDVASPASQPAACLAELDPQVDVLAGDVHALDLRARRAARGCSPGALRSRASAPADPRCRESTRR